jgi:membrane protein DedA with SNARE-associated domain
VATLIEKILTPVVAFIASVISAMGYPGIVLLMGIESACIPLPSEAIMPFAGYIVSRGEMNLWLAGLAGAIGCNLGSIVGYWLGAKGGRPAILRYGRYVLMSPHELELVERWFARWGEVTVFVARLLPVVRTFIAFPAGVAKMNQFRFHLYTFLGSLPWCLALAFVGKKLGDNWQSIKVYFHKADVVIVAIVVLGGAWFVWTRVRTLRHAGQRAAAPEKSQAGEP